MHPPFSWTSELEDFARATALAAGFHLASVADVEFVPGGAASLDGERFAAWVEAGSAQPHSRLSGNRRARVCGKRQLRRRRRKGNKRKRKTKRSHHGSESA